MPDAFINMDAPPAALHTHAALLDHARNVMIAYQPVFAAKGLSLDELVVVAREPKLAALDGMPVVSIELREATLRRFTHPEHRAFVVAPLPPGWMKVVVVAQGSTLMLTMNVTTPPTNAIKVPPFRAD